MWEVPSIEGNLWDVFLYESLVSLSLTEQVIVYEFINISISRVKYTVHHVSYLHKLKLS